MPIFGLGIFRVFGIVVDGVSDRLEQRTGGTNDKKEGTPSVRGVCHTKNDRQERDMWTE